MQIPISMPHYQHYMLFYLFGEEGSVIINEVRIQELGKERIQKSGVGNAAVSFQQLAFSKKQKAN